MILAQMSFCRIWDWLGLEGGAGIGTGSGIGAGIETGSDSVLSGVCANVEQAISSVIIGPTIDWLSAESNSLHDRLHGDLCSSICIPVWIQSSSLPGSEQYSDDLVESSESGSATLSISINSTGARP